MISFRKKWLVLPLLTAACCLGALKARANLLQALPEMGDLERWALFSLGAGVSDVDQLSGNNLIKGDVGVAGSGNITMSGNATINGDLYWRTPGTLTMSGNATITGARHHNASSDSQLDNGVSEANATSAHAATFTSSFAYSGITSITSSITLNAQHDRPGNSTVLNLTNFLLSDHSTVTLNGSNTDVFIINVSNQFSLTAQSKIVLTGGLAWDDVLFNIKGTGSNVTLDGQSKMTGILMANKRTVQMAGGSIVFGEVIANKVQLSGNSQIIRPPITSP
jgi:hypothetical protein